MRRPLRNKRLSEVLAWEGPETRDTTLLVETTSVAGGYVLRPKGRRGRISFVDQQFASGTAEPAANE
jgi:hypothetical protein